MTIKITITNAENDTNPAVVLVRHVDAKNKSNNRHCDEELAPGQSASFWIHPNQKLIVSEATAEELATGSGKSEHPQDQ